MVLPDCKRSHLIPVATCEQWRERGLQENARKADVWVSEDFPPGKVFCDVESEPGVGITVVGKHNILFYPFCRTFRHVIM